MTKENKSCTYDAFADLGKLRAADMTGAKLLGMHETVTSPKSTDLTMSHGDAGVVERSYADDVGA